jgi:hypothetical protein
MEDLLVLTSENIRSSKLTITFFFQIEMVVVTVHLSLFLAEKKNRLYRCCVEKQRAALLERIVLLF